MTAVPTTPTPWYSFGSVTIEKRFPSGSRPGQSILAMASLMTTTGVVFSRSKSVKSRPRNRGMRIVSKWPGVTSSKLTRVPRLLGSVCSPSRKMVPRKPPPNMPFDDTEDQPGQQRDDHGKSQHAGIERKIDRAIQKKRWPEGPQHIASPIRYQQTGQTAHQRKQGAFRQKLTHQPQPPSAHRRANAQLFLAFGGLREEQIGQVDARDQQHQADHTHQHAAGKRKLPPLIDPQRRFVQRI